MDIETEKVIELVYPDGIPGKFLSSLHPPLHFKIIPFIIIYFIYSIYHVSCFFFFKDSWKENPDFYQYLSKIGGFDVDQLNKEPDHLTEEKNTVLQTTQELAFKNYKTFIQTAESSREIFHQVCKTKILKIKN